MSYTLVRNLVAIVLLAAAGLKAHQLATEPVAGVGLLDSRWFLIAAVEFELFFGLWLLSGSATCGCFGRVGVNPWYTAVG